MCVFARLCVCVCACVRVLRVCECGFVGVTFVDVLISCPPLPEAITTLSASVAPACVQRVCVRACQYIWCVCVSVHAVSVRVCEYVFVSMCACVHPLTPLTAVSVHEALKSQKYVVTLVTSFDVSLAYMVVDVCDRICGRMGVWACAHTRALKSQKYGDLSH